MRYNLNGVIHKILIIPLDENNYRIEYYQDEQLVDVVSRLSWDQTKERIRQDKRTYERNGGTRLA